MRCPECGLAVGYSLQGDLLQFSDPDWVDNLGKGAQMIVWGIVGIILAGIIAGVLGASRGGQTAAGMAVIVGLIMIGGWIVITLGWWMLTQPDPSGLGEERYGTARKIIRIALIVGIANQLLSMIIQVAPLDPGVYMMFAVLSALAGLVGVVGIFAQLIYLEKITRRIPDDRLSSRAYTVRWGLTISYGMMILFGAIVGIMGYSAARSGAPPSGGAFIGLACIVGLAMIAALVFWVMYLFLLVGVGNRFRESAQIARSSWAATQWAGRGAPPR
jgi:hypothetical protein